MAKNTNLLQHRSERGVWDRVEYEAGWDVERWVAALTAGACLANGFRRRSVAGLLLIISGSALAWWASAGLEERRVRRGRLRAALFHRPATDEVAEASEESFPASDAPAWSPTTATGASPLNH